MLVASHHDKEAVTIRSSNAVESRMGEKIVAYERISRFAPLLLLHASSTGGSVRRLQPGFLDWSDYSWISQLVGKQVP